MLTPEETGLSESEYAAFQQPGGHASFQVLASRLNLDWEWTAYATGIPWPAVGSATATGYAGIPDDCFDAEVAADYLIRARIAGTVLHIDRWADMHQSESSLSAFTTQMFGGLLSAPPAAQWYYYEDQDYPIVKFYGTWVQYNHASAHGGSVRYTNYADTGYGTKTTFRGQKIRVIFTKASYMGIVDVYIDGEKVGSIDAYSASLQWQQSVEYTVTPGTHTIDIQTTGTKNASSTDYYFYFDAFQVLELDLVSIPPSLIYENGVLRCFFHDNNNTIRYLESNDAGGTWSGPTTVLTGLTRTRFAAVSLNELYYWALNVTYQVYELRMIRYRSGAWNNDAPANMIYWPYEIDSVDAVRLNETQDLVVMGTDLPSTLAMVEGVKDYYAGGVVGFLIQNNYWSDHVEINALQDVTPQNFRRYTRASWVNDRLAVTALGSSGTEMYSHKEHRYQTSKDGENWSLESVASLNNSLYGGVKLLRCSDFLYLVSTREIARSYITDLFGVPLAALQVDLTSRIRDYNAAFGRMRQSTMFLEDLDWFETTPLAQPGEFMLKHYLGYWFSGIEQDFLDQFTDTNGKQLYLHTPDPGPFLPWNEHSGEWQIYNNRAVPYTGTPNPSSPGWVAAVDSGYWIYALSSNLMLFSGKGGLLAQYPVSDFIGIYIEVDPQEDTFKIRYWNGSAWEDRASRNVITGYGIPYFLQVTVDLTTNVIRATLNQANEISAPGIQVSDEAGIYGIWSTTSGSNYFDNFKIERVTTQPKRILVATETLDAIERGVDLPEKSVRIAARDRMAWMTDTKRSPAIYEQESQIVGVDSFVDYSKTGYGGMRHTAVQRGDWRSRNGELWCDYNGGMGSKYTVVALSTFASLVWNGSIESKVRWDNLGGTALGVGLVARSRDSDNGIQVFYNPGGGFVIMDNREGWWESVATSGSITINPTAWFRMKVVTRYAQIRVYYNTNPNDAQFLLACTGIQKGFVNVAAHAGEFSQQGHFGFFGYGNPTGRHLFKFKDVIVNDAARAIDGERAVRLFGVRAGLYDFKFDPAIDESGSSLDNWSVWTGTWGVTSEWIYGESNNTSLWRVLRYIGNPDLPGDGVVHLRKNSSVTAGAAAGVGFRATSPAEYYAFYWSNTVCGFAHVVNNTVAQTTVLAELPVALPNECDLDIAFREMSFTSGLENELWLVMSAYCNGQHVLTTATRVWPSNPPGTGILLVTRNVGGAYYSRYKNVYMGNLGGIVDYATLDPGETPEIGLGRALGPTSRARMFVRYDGVLRAWIPKATASVQSIGSGGRYRYTRTFEPRRLITHVRVIGGYSAAEHIRHDLIPKYGYRFQEITNQALMSEPECYREAVRAIQLSEEDADRFQLEGPAYLLLEPEDHIALIGVEDFVVEQINMELRGPELTGPISGRKYVFGS